MQSHSLLAQCLHLLLGLQLKKIKTLLNVKHLTKDFAKYAQLFICSS